MSWEPNWHGNPAHKPPGFGVRVPAALGGDPNARKADWRGLLRTYTGPGHERFLTAIDSGDSPPQQLGRQFLIDLQNTSEFAEQRQAAATGHAPAGPAASAAQAGVAQKPPGGFLNRITAAAGGGGPEAAQEAAGLRPAAPPPPPPPPIVIQQEPQWKQAAGHAGMARDNWLELERMRAQSAQQVEMIRAQAQERIATIQAMGAGGATQVAPAGVAVPEHVQAPGVSAGGAAAVQPPQEALGAAVSALNQRAVEAIEQVEDPTTRTRWFSGAHQLLADAGHAIPVDQIGRHAILTAPDGLGAKAVVDAFGHINVQTAAQAGKVTDEAGAAKVFASATTSLAKVLGMIR